VALCIICHNIFVSSQQRHIKIWSGGTFPRAPSKRGALERAPSKRGQLKGPLDTKLRQFMVLSGVSPKRNIQNRFGTSQIISRRIVVTFNYY